MLRVLRLLPAVLVAMLFASAWLSVNIFAVATNDSLAYLTHGQGLLGGGLVENGYRQLGYPAFLAFVRGAGSIVGGNELLWVSLTQRSLLLVAILYLVWLWRWWSVPVVLVAALPSFVAYTNLLLTEGLAVSLVLLLAATTTHSYGMLTRSSQLPRLPERLRGAEGRLKTLSVAAVAILSFALLTTRYTYVVFGVAPLLLMFVGRSVGDRSIRKFTMQAFVGYMIAAVAFSAALAVENLTEHGELSPSTRTSRTEYWAAWHAVFSLAPENATKAELTGFYDEGSPYGYIGMVDKLSSVDSQNRAFERRIHDLLRAANLKRADMQAKAFVGALRGGRIDDVAGVLRVTVEARRHTLVAAAHQNGFSAAQGEWQFADRFNSGDDVGAIVTQDVLAGPALPDYKRTLSWIAPLSLVALGLVALLRRGRALAFAGIAPPLVLGAAAALTLADNVRFLLVVILWCIAIAGPASKMVRLDQAIACRFKWLRTSSS
jgi:hypothetical protein